MTTKTLDGNDYLEQTFRKSLTHKVLETDEERTLICQAQKGCKASMAKLVAKNQRLIGKVISKYIGCGVSKYDLWQEGNLGLLKGIDKFDLERGTKFSTYVTWWIRQAVSRAIADQGRTIRLPVHLNDQVAKVYQTMRILEQELGREPTTEEIADYLDCDESKVVFLLRVSQHTASLDEKFGDDDRFADDNDGHNLHYNEDTPSLDDLTDGNERSEAIANMLNTLPVREGQILKLRFGLVDGQPRTLEEVGQKFGVTRERIRQIEAGALRKLRHPRRARKLKDFMEVSSV